MDWFRAHTREVMLGVMVVVAIVIGSWLYARSADIKAGNAEQALRSAEMQLAVGNTDGAQAELETIVQRFEGTTAGTMAAIRLARLLYEKREFEAGISRLEAAHGGARRGPLASSVSRLIGAGHEELGNFAEAARYYQAAAGETELELERAMARAAAARALAGAGDRAGAIAIWEDLAADSQSPVAPEARLRLGELIGAAAVGG
jgi:predicted negative regulator of RcsB-dependent stress response